MRSLHGPGRFPVAREEAAASGRMTSRMTARNERIEVITRGERRRSWTMEEKREIAVESLAPGAAAGIVKLTPLEMTLHNIRRVESLPGPALLSSSLTWAAGNC